MAKKKKETKIEEVKEDEVVFNDYDEPEFTEEQELEMYGPKPETAPTIPQSHGEDEAYEIGDTNI